MSGLPDVGAVGVRAWTYRHLLAWRVEDPVTYRDGCAEGVNDEWPIAVDAAVRVFLPQDWFVMRTIQIAERDAAGARVVLRTWTGLPPILFEAAVHALGRDDVIATGAQWPHLDLERWNAVEAAAEAWGSNRLSTSRWDRRREYRGLLVLGLPPSPELDDAWHEADDEVEFAVGEALWQGTLRLAP